MLTINKTQSNTTTNRDNVNNITPIARLPLEN